MFHVVIFAKCTRDALGIPLLVPKLFNLEVHVWPGWCALFKTKMKLSDFRLHTMYSKHSLIFWKEVTFCAYILKKRGQIIAVSRSRRSRHSDLLFDPCCVTGGWGNMFSQSITNIGLILKVKINDKGH